MHDKGVEITPIRTPHKITFRIRLGLVAIIVLWLSMSALTIYTIYRAKGALEEDMGKAVPALLVFAKDGDRYPEEVFPRSDKDLGRLVGVEEALQNLINKA